MKIFNLPDLGEGLAEAEIREWYVKEGDTVISEQPLAAVETAKALVDVPSPFAGKITKLYGANGDIIKTGHPLVAFSQEGAEARPDSGTVVGNVEVGHKVLQEEATGVKPSSTSSTRIKATPAVRALAKALNLDLAQIKATGADQSITLEDVQNAGGKKENANTAAAAPANGEALHGARRAMAINMAIAHREVVPVTIMDRADIQHWNDNNYTVRIIQAMAAACQAEPSLNAHFDGKTLSRKLFQEVNIGLAVDSPEGLYVPVLKDANKLSKEKLREQIEQFKTLAKKQAFPLELLQGATIVLSNFGLMSGYFANPIVMPPTVAILGIGKISQEVLPVNNQAEIRKTLPLSLTFDHRAVTGGEAARFLSVLIKNL